MNTILYTPGMHVGWERGNVFRSPHGRTIEIDEEHADRLKVGRRQQRSGLLYDPGHPGCTPWAWPRVLASPTSGREEGVRVTLGPVDGMRESVVFVCRDSKCDPRLYTAAETLMAEHVPVRTSDSAVGRMAGAGVHGRQDGLVGEFVVADACARHRVSTAMRAGGSLLAPYFSGQGVGWEDMLSEQARVFPWKSDRYPACFNVSDGLGNAMHLDPRDGSRSFACWVSEEGHRGRSRNWWFLFPRHGLAIELSHGTFISWDGRVAPHCTCVPDVAEGERLMSLFCSLPVPAVHLRDRLMSIQEQLRARAGQSGCALFESLYEGQTVAYIYVPPVPSHVQSAKARKKWNAAHVRAVRATVVAKGAEWVHVQDEGCVRKIFELSVQDVGNRLVLR